MQFILGRKTVTQTGANDDFKSMETRLLAPSFTANRQPCRAMLKLFARSCAGKMIGHPLTKAVAGPMLALGVKINCLGMDNDWLGDYAPVLASSGAALFVISTAMSTCNRPRFEPVVKHLAQSIGYGVAGAPLAVLHWATWLCCRQTLELVDINQVGQQVVVDVDQVGQQVAPDYDAFADGSEVDLETPLSEGVAMDPTGHPATAVLTTTKKNQLTKGSPHL